VSENVIWLASVCVFVMFARIFMKVRTATTTQEHAV
jgi:hypothetical protein